MSWLNIFNRKPRSFEQVEGHKQLKRQMGCPLDADEERDVRRYREIKFYVSTLPLDSGIRQHFEFLFDRLENEEPMRMSGASALDFNHEQEMLEIDKQFNFLNTFPVDHIDPLMALEMLKL